MGNSGSNAIKDSSNQLPSQQGRAAANGSSDGRLDPGFEDNAFSNPWDDYNKPPSENKEQRSRWSFIYSKLTEDGPRMEVLNRELPVGKPDWDRFFTTNLSLIWIGHASVLVNLDGLIILADPIFSERCSPVQWMGPRRFRPVPFTPQQMRDEFARRNKSLHAICVSHSHYDHLDSGSVESLARLFPDAHFFVPLKMRELLISWGVAPAQVYEFTWWAEALLGPSGAGTTEAAAGETNSKSQSSKSKTPVQCPDEAFKAHPYRVLRNESVPTIISQSLAITLGADSKGTNQNASKFRVICLPTQHWSKRNLFGSNDTLWSSWLFESLPAGSGSGQANLSSKGKKFYFTGDTGYSGQIFSTIGNHYGPIDLAAIPIGAYKPRHVMERHHIGPFEAVKLHRELQSKQSVAIHWGTFGLGGESYMDPKEDLERALTEAQIQKEKFITVGHGQLNAF